MPNKDTGEANGAFLSVRTEREIEHKIKELRKKLESLDLLKELNLIRTEIDKSVFPNRNMIFLTTKGSMIAEHIKQIEEILE